MTRKPATCLEIEPALIAAATSEADTTTAARGAWQPARLAARPASGAERFPSRGAHRDGANPVRRGALVRGYRARAGAAVGHARRGPGAPLESATDRRAVPPRDRALRRAHRLRGRQAHAQAAAPVRRGRAGPEDRPRLPGAPGRHVRALARRLRLLPAELHLDPGGAAPGADALRLARACRGCRARALLGLPPRPPSDFTLTVARCLRVRRSPHADTAPGRHRRIGPGRRGAGARDTRPARGARARRSGHTADPAHGRDPPRARRRRRAVRDAGSPRAVARVDGRAARPPGARRRRPRRRPRRLPWPIRPRPDAAREPRPT